MYKKEQSLDEWASMLDAIYGGSQNYAKTPYEIHTHLTEVCGILAKHLFKKNNVEAAAPFLPKIFAWTTALLKKMQPNASIEEVVLRKFPNVCPYCLERQCVCWKVEKPTFNGKDLRDIYFRNAQKIPRTVNDFQYMFKRIYSESWANGMDREKDALEICRAIFVRLIEEVAEVGETIRFHHLFPDNFENELSDLLAWWFALLSSFPASQDCELLAEEILWGAYPGRCPDCQTAPCLCRPGPVRQLMSRPIPGSRYRFDEITSLSSHAAYEEDLPRFRNGTQLLRPPISCAFLDIDNFKSVNDTPGRGHGAGDEALRHIAQVLRRTVRECDLIYRRGGDEFIVICPGFTEEEAAGMMRRVNLELAMSPVKWVPRGGSPADFIVSLSGGIDEVEHHSEIDKCLECAEKAAYVSKEQGRNRVTRYSGIPV